MKNKLIRFQNTEWIMPFLFSKGMYYIPILKEILGEEFKAIKYVYGSPTCKWAGGRITLFNIKNLNLIEKVISSVLEYDITPEFTLSNTNITKEDLNDEYCNELLKIINDSNSQVICSSDVLFDYIKNKYPNIQTVASLIKFFINKFDNVENETKYINDLSKLYDKVVISNEYYLKNPELKNINDKSKIAIISNYTRHNCPHGQKHYELISKFNKNEITYEEGYNQVAKFCPKINNPNHKEERLTDDEINFAIKSGIKYLKLQGRDMDFDIIFEILINNFFNNNIEKENLKKEIDNYCKSKLQNSLDLQIYSLVKGI